MTETVITSGKPVQKRPGIDRQRRVILSAAIELFSASGGTGPSVSEICRAAGISRDTFYRCFADKDALINHLYQTSVNDHIEAVLASWALNYSDREWLHRVSARTIDAILREHKVAQFLFVESADPNSPAHKAIHSAYTKAAKRMQRWCRDNGKTVPDRELFVALLVATQWLVHNAIISGMKQREVRRAKEVAEQLFSAIFASV